MASRARSASWGSPEAPTDVAPSAARRERARTPTRGKKAPVGQGFNAKRSVAVIGYLPDLAPLVRPDDAAGAEAQPSAGRAGALAGGAGDGGGAYGSPLLLPADDYPIRNAIASPMTPLMNAFRGGKEGLAKWFREGSVRGSVFNLCSATLGAGALSLPFAFSKAGWALGLVMLLVGALATTYSIHLLMRARIATACTSYEDLTVNIFGRTMGYFVEVNIMVFCFGTAVAYIIAVGDILEPALELTGLDHTILKWFGDGASGGNSSMLSLYDVSTSPSSSSSSSSASALTPSQVETLRVVSMVTFFCLIMFPLSLLEKINSLRFTSFFGVAAIFYLVFSTVYQSVAALEHGGWDATWGRTSAVNTDFFSIVQAAPIIMFAFTCQVNVFSIYDELERASPRRMGKVTNQAILTCLLVYLGMGVFGYLQFGSATQGNVLQNCFPTQNPMVIVSFAAITLTIVMAFPLVVFPCRYTVDVMFFHSHDHDGGGSGGDGKVPLLQAGESPQQRRIVEFQPDVATGALREVSPTIARDAASSKQGGSSYGTETHQQGSAATSSFAGHIHSQCPKLKHFALTTVICAAALVLALKVSKIQIVFQLMGGTTSAFVCFILPAAFAIRLQREGRLRMSGLEMCASWGLACGGAAVGLLSTFVTVYNIAVPGVHN